MPFTPTARALAVRSVPCPRCNAAIGARCMTRTGRNATGEHAERYEAAAREGTWPQERTA